MASTNRISPPAVALGAVAALGALAVLAAPARADERVTEIAGADDIGDWVIDPDSGRLFASRHGSASVVEYDPATGREVRAFEVPEKPTELIVKRGRLVVACQTTVSLAVIDLQKNEVEGRVQLGGKGPYALFCSQARNDWVYAICNTGDAWWDGEVFQVDVRRRKVRNRQEVDQRGQKGGGTWRQMNPRNVVMTPDGEHILIDGHHSPSRADLMAVDERDFTFRDVRGYHSSFGQIAGGPNGRFWTLGNALYPLDIAEPIREFAGGPVAIHPSSDLVVALVSKDRWDPSRGVALHFQQLSDAKTLSKIDITPPAAGRDGRRGHDPERWRDEPTLVFDAKNGRAIYGFGERAYVIDVKSLALPSGPLVLLKVPAQTDAEIDRELRIPLALSDEKLAKKARFRIEEGPDGARIERDALVWTPTAADVGSHTLRIAATVGESKDVAKLRVDVARPFVALGASATALHVDAAGRRALVVSSPERGFDREGAATTQLVLIDLQQKQVIARRELSQPVRLAHIDEKAVYFAPQQGNLFRSLSLTDLSDARRAFTDEPVASFATLPDGRLAVGTRMGTATFEAGSLAKLAAADPRDAFRMMDDGPAVAPLTDGWLVRDRVVDANGETLMLLAGLGLPVASSAHTRTPPPTLWNRTLRHGGLTGPGNAQIATWRDGAAVVLREQPAALVCRVENRRDGETSRRLVALDVRDLVVGSVRQQLVLADLPVENGGGGYSRDRALLAAEGGRAVVAHGERLFVLDAPAVADLPRPVELAHRVQPFAVAADAKTTVKLAASGGKGAHTFELLLELPGVAIDSTSGEVTVDGAAVWKSFTARIEKEIARGGRGLGGKPAGEIIAEAQERYRRLTGEKTDRFPIEVPLHVAASDAEGQRDRLGAALVLLAPADEARTLLRQAERARPAGPTVRVAARAPTDPAAEAASLRNQGQIAELGRTLDRTDQGLEQARAESAAVTARVEELVKELADARAATEKLGDRSDERLDALAAQLDRIVERLDEPREPSGAGAGTLLGAIGLGLGGLALALAIAALLRRPPAPPVIVEARPAAAEERVRVACECGKRFRVRAARSGKKVACPACRERVLVP